MIPVRPNAHPKKRLTEETKTDQNPVAELLYGAGKEKPQGVHPRTRSQAFRRTEHYKKMREKHNQSCYANMNVSENSSSTTLTPVEKPARSFHRTRTFEKAGK